MAIEAHERHAPSPLQTLALAALAATALLFWGSWKFVISNDALEGYTQHLNSRHQVQHTIPVGGEVLDGVYHSSGRQRDSQPHPFTTLSRCSASLPMAGAIASSTLRMSSKL